MLPVGNMRAPAPRPLHLGGRQAPSDAAQLADVRTHASSNFGSVRIPVGLANSAEEPPAAAVGILSAPGDLASTIDLVSGARLAR
jgi:hypothetical protein